MCRLFFSVTLVLLIVLIGLGSVQSSHLLQLLVILWFLATHESLRSGWSGLDNPWIKISCFSSFPQVPGCSIAIRSLCNQCRCIAEQHYTSEVQKAAFLRITIFQTLQSIHFPSKSDRHLTIIDTKSCAAMDYWFTFCWLTLDPCGFSSYLLWTKYNLDQIELKGWKSQMAVVAGDLKRSVSLNTAARRQNCLSECLTQATLTQARENLAS